MYREESRERMKKREKGVLLHPLHQALVVPQDHWNDDNEQEGHNYQGNNHLHLHVSPPHPSVQLFGSATEGRRVVR